MQIAILMREDASQTWFFDMFHCCETANAETVHLVDVKVKGMYLCLLSVLAI